jgi:hypothetical protein
MVALYPVVHPAWLRFSRLRGMLLAPVVSDAHVSTPIEAKPAPAGWAPPTLNAVTSRFGSDRTAALVGLWRGVREPGPGQALSAAMVSTLGPYLAAAYGQPVAAVTGALEGVSIYLGGPASGSGFAAVVHSNRVYVPDAGWLRYITSWDGRALLAHELGHIVQRLLPDDRVTKLLGGGELGRDRAAVVNYAINLPGAYGAAAKAWIGARLPGSSGDRKTAFQTLVHDLHALENQAERVAIAFRDATA